MKEQIRYKIIKDISQTLLPYDQTFAGHFLCPICFKMIEIEDLKEISVAHIIPKASGGKITTWLCKKCNNRLGMTVDKWFGQYLNAINRKTLFHEDITNLGFTIDGIKLNGTVQSDMNGIRILIDTRRNSPETLKRFEDEMTVKKHQRKFEIKIPLLGKKSHIDIGFITAAYLYGFSMFGYSWVMQKHFDQVREAILNCDEEIAKNVYISEIKNDPDKRKHYFGIATVNNYYIPFFKIIDRCVFFSPSYDTNCLENISSKNGIFDINTNRLNGIPNQIYTNPFLLIVGDKIIIYPDKGKNKVPFSFVLYVDQDDFKVTILNTFVDEDYEKKLLAEGKVFKRVSIHLTDTEGAST